MGCRWSWPPCLRTLATGISISPSGSANCIGRAQKLQVELRLEPGVVLARSDVQLELFAEPGIVVAENPAQPIKRRSHRPGIEPVGECDRIERHGYRLHQLERDGGGLQHGVAAE